MKPFRLCGETTAKTCLCIFLLSTANWAATARVTSTSSRTVFRRLEDSQGSQAQPNGTAATTPSSTSSTTTTTTTSSSDYPRPYHLMPPFQIKETMYQWVNYYPDLVRLTTAQDEYGLPTAGEANDCPYEDDVAGCKNYILTIQDYIQHPVDSDSSNRLPEVFLSGELHGNERVGPTSVIEAAQLLLLAADCEAKPNRSAMDTSQHSFNEKNTDWQSQLKAAKDCRAQLKQQHGMDDVHRKWLARIVSTRRIVIVPTANALGYFRNRRTEGMSDPNRDFPYDVSHPTECMKTIAGRTLNEIYREHMFQLSLTFHGGMEVVAYEWGAKPWLGKFSPDHTAQNVIGGAYSQYGGGFATSKPYRYGTMNDLVYWVEGGFEDWAYAGSWDPERVTPCEPESFDGYDKEKTVYNNSTLRVFNMLVETSNQKEPRDNTLGNSLDVLDGDTTGNGHVSRNIRLSLLATDAVQPYLHMVGVNDLTLTNDIIPLSTTSTEQERDSCQSVMVAGNQKDVTLRWTVGGAFEIDTTELYYAKWDDVPELALGCNTNTNHIALKHSHVDKYFKKATVTSDTTGTGFFSDQGPAPGGDSGEALGPVFSAQLDVSHFNTHEKLVVIATARVDQSWKDKPEDVDIAPNLPPQSHIVNARTNPDWHHESAGKVIQGRLDWYSLPLTLVVGDYNDNVGNQGGRPVGTVELSNRFGETTGEFKGGVTPSTSTATPSTATSTSEASKDGVTPSEGAAFPDSDSTSSSGGMGGAQILGVCVLVACLFFVYRRYSGYKRRPATAYASANAFQDDDDDDAEYGGSGYSDKHEVELNSYDR